MSLFEALFTACASFLFPIALHNDYASVRVPRKETRSVLTAKKRESDRCYLPIRIKELRLPFLFDLTDDLLRARFTLVIVDASARKIQFLFVFSKSPHCHNIDAPTLVSAYQLPVQQHARTQITLACLCKCVIRFRRYCILHSHQTDQIEGAGLQGTCVQIGHGHTHTICQALQGLGRTLSPNATAGLKAAPDCCPTETAPARSSQCIEKRRSQWLPSGRGPL